MLRFDDLVSKCTAAFDDTLSRSVNNHANLQTYFDELRAGIQWDQYVRREISLEVPTLALTSSKRDKMLRI